MTQAVSSFSQIPGLMEFKGRASGDLRERVGRIIRAVGQDQGVPAECEDQVWLTVWAIQSLEAEPTPAEKRRILESIGRSARRLEKALAELPGGDRRLIYAGQLHIDEVGIATEFHRAIASRAEALARGLNVPKGAQRVLPAAIEAAKHAALLLENYVSKPRISTTAGGPFVEVTAAILDAAGVRSETVEGACRLMVRRRQAENAG